MKNLLTTICASLLMLAGAQADNLKVQSPFTPGATPCEGLQIKGFSQVLTKGEPKGLTNLYNTPQGEIRHYSTQASLHTFMGFMRFRGVVNDVCIDGNDVYIGTLSPLSVVGNFWVKGTLDENGDITFLPQAVMNSDLGYLGEQYTFGIGKLLLSEPDENNQVSVTGIAQEGFKMHLDEEGVISMVEPKAYIALYYCDEQAQPVLSSKGAIQIEDYSYGFILHPVLLGAAELPQGAEPTPLNVIYRKHNNVEYSELGSIYTEGNDAYISGLVPDLATQYVKGTINGDKIEIPAGQFLCDVHNEDYDVVGYFGDFVHCMDAFMATDEKDEDGYTLTLPVASVELNKVEEGHYELTAGQFVADASPGHNYYEYYYDMSLSEFQTEYMPVPVAPHEINLNNMTSKYGETTFQVVFYWYNKSVNGEYIDPNQLSYRVFFDDYLYEFTAEDYPDFGEYTGTTEIPWYGDFNSVYYYELFGMKAHIFFFYDDLFNTMGIQGINTIGDKRTYSDIAVVDHNGTRLPDVPASAIKEVAPDHANEVIYYDIQGHRLDAPKSGTFVIARMVMADGSVKSFKVRY